MLVQLDFKIRKACIDHQCAECSGTIFKGEKYVDEVLKEDCIYNWRSHLDCNACAEEVWSKDGLVIFLYSRPPLIEQDNFLQELDEYASRYPNVVKRIKAIFRKDTVL